MANQPTRSASRELARRLAHEQPQQYHYAASAEENPCGRQAKKHWTEAVQEISSQDGRSDACQPRALFPGEGARVQQPPVKGWQCHFDPRCQQSPQGDENLLAQWGVRRSREHRLDVKGPGKALEEQNGQHEARVANTELQIPSPCGETVSA